MGFFGKYLVENRKLRRSMVHFTFFKRSLYNYTVILLRIMYIFSIVKFGTIFHQNTSIHFNF